PRDRALLGAEGRALAARGAGARAAGGALAHRARRRLPLPRLGAARRGRLRARGARALRGGAIAARGAHRVRAVMSAAPRPIDLEAMFCASGPLARAVPGFRQRPEQVEFARAVL